MPSCKPQTDFRTFKQNPDGYSEGGAPLCSSAGVLPCVVLQVCSPCVLQGCSPVFGIRDHVDSDSRLVLKSH